MTETLERLSAALADRYRLEHEVGAGGMATVYLAEDLKHHRKVALKVLRPELAAILGADRFVHEITVTANLQHPNILPLYDSGEAGTFLYYVMPYVEGESLREKLSRERQLAVEKAVGIATAVAGALQYAHEQGIVHRDIKPENILLSRGQPLLADFGIALAISRAGGPRLTETGLSLGTPHYMSPEQAAGDRELDARSDVYSLGAVVYEMLTGEPPHSGTSAQAIVAKILSERPSPISRTRDLVPPNVDAAVQKALAKSPADRFTTAGRFAEALTNPSFTITTATPAPAGPSARRPALVPFLAATTVLATAAALWGWGRPGAPEQVARWSVVLPDSAQLLFVGEAALGVGRRALDISPDGRTIVYAGAKGSTTQLYVRPTNSQTVRALPGTEGASAPFFSPDGESVGFFIGDQLMRMSLLANEPSVVAEAADAHGASWSDDGRIAASIHDGTELLILDLASGTQRSLPSNGIDPEWVPGSEWILQTCNAVVGWLCATSAESGELRYLSRSGPAVTEHSDGSIVGWDPTVVAGNVLLYTIPDANVLKAVRFDPRSLTTSGPHEEVLRGIRREGFTYEVQAAVSDDGTLVFAAGGDANFTELVWAGRGGSETEVGFSLGRYGAFALSPNGTRLIIQATSPAGVNELRRLDLVRRTEQKWTGQFTPLAAWTWLPNGREFYATFVDDNKYRILRVDADAMSGGRPIYEGIEMAVIESVLPDGQVVVNWLVPRRLSAHHEDELQRYGSSGSSPAPPLLPDAGGQLFAAVSPDGTWMTYASGASGRYEVVARRYPSLDRRTMISFDGGELATWSPRGDGFYYRDGQRWYWVARQDSESEPFAAPALFTTGSYMNVAGPEHAVSPRGDRLLVLRVPGEAGTRELEVVVNWLSEVRGRLRRPN